MATSGKSPAKNRTSGTSGTTDSTDPAEAVLGNGIEPHAQLRDQQGKLLAGIVRRDGEWVLGMGGKIAGGSSEAAQVFALIRRAAVLHEAQGTPVRLTWSDAIKDAAERESASSGVSFDEYERQLLRTMNGVAAADDSSEVSDSGAG